MNVVIMAAGRGARWVDYHGGPKQMLPIDDEALLHRTIRQVHERTDDPIFVTVPEFGAFGMLDISGEIVGTDDCEIDKFLNAPLATPILYLWGDTYFTEAAMDTIFENHPIPTFFGRRAGNDVKPYGELFAAKLGTPEIRSARYLRSIRDSIPRCASWELYRVVIGRALDDPTIGPCFVDIDDETEDFDYPYDFELWFTKHLEVGLVENLNKM